MLYIADEVFLTGTAAKITPIKQLETTVLSSNRPIMNKLREMIIDKFPYTEDIFPKVNLIEEFKIDSDVLNDSKVICD